MERVSRSKAIRLKCIDCCCGNMAEVRRCPAEQCPLWRYRMGKEIRDGVSEETEHEASSENPSFSDETEDEDLE